MMNWNNLDEETIKEIANLEIMRTTNDFVITGATGVIGSTLILFLNHIKEAYKYSFNIHALCRDEEKLRRLVGDDVIYQKYSMTDEIILDLKSPVIIHCASPTSTSLFLNKPTHVQHMISLSTQYISKFAEKTQAKKLVSLSTMEVYGEQFENILIKEEDYFGIDPINPRNSYPIAKLSTENYLIGKYKEVNLPVSIIRLTQTIAPPIDLNDNRVIFSFAKSVLQDDDILMKTTGMTFRSYIDIFDVLTAILVVSDSGVDGEVYNAGTPDTCVSIVGLAERLIQISKSESKIVFKLENNENTGYRDSLGLCLNSEKLIKIGWKPVYDLNRSLSRLLNNYQELLNQSV